MGQLRGLSIVSKGIFCILWKRRCSSNLHDPVQGAVDSMGLPAGGTHLDEELLCQLPLPPSLQGVDEAAAGDHICQHPPGLHVVKHLLTISFA